MTEKCNRLRLLMLKVLSDPKFIYHMAIVPPDGDPLLNRLVFFVKSYGISRLTFRQKRIFECVLCGMTQGEISGLYNVHQTSIQKSLHGNIIYTGSCAGRRYGGIFWKLAKAIVGHTEACDILEQIVKLDAAKPAPIQRGRLPWKCRLRSQLAEQRKGILKKEL